MSKYIRVIWLSLAAFFIGRINICEINPLVVAFVVATCVEGVGNIFIYLLACVGVYSVFPINTFVRYSVMLFGIMVILNIKTFMELRGNRNILAGLAGIFVIIINLSVGFLVDGVIGADIGITEGVVVAGFGVIFAYGIKVIMEDYAKITVENEAAIGVFAIATAVFAGMPDELFQEIVFAEAIAIFGTLFALYKFGFCIGMVWTSICGIVMSYSNEAYIFIVAWMTVALVSFYLACTMNAGRLLFGVIYLITYYMFGVLFFERLITENGQKAVLSATILFVFLPTEIMVRVDDRIKGNELRENSPEWGRLMIKRINALAMACKRIEYTLAGDGGSGTSFSDIGDIIEGFTNQLDRAVPIRKTTESKILEKLRKRDIQVKSLLLTKNREDRYEVYVNARVRRGAIISAEQVVDIVSKEMGVKLSLMEESRRIISKNYELICMREKARYICKTAVRRMSKYREKISGDNFYIGEILDGNKLIMIADGMGSGENANDDSSRLIDAIEDLLMAGFDKDMAIKIVNSYLAEQSHGEHFSTLDMLILDLHTASGIIYKQGAATTYIKRGEWMELIKSTSLPVGVIDGAVCEKSIKKFYDKDIIVMVSDGVLDSIIFENKDDYMMELLQKNQYLEPEEIADELVNEIKSMSGNRLKDDATVIVSRIEKRC